MMDELLSVRDLRVGFRIHEGELEVVRGLSFRILRASTVAIVGESGSGKSVTAQAILGILPKAARITGGRILLADASGDGEVDIARLAPDGRAMQSIRGERISMIFQEPMSALSPVHTVGDQVGEVARLHMGLGRAAARNLARDMLRLAQFPDPDRALNAYPFELSGGLRQRAAIAMALICRPALLIADEPTTALDVTIQAEILALLRDLQKDFGMAVMMITHDLGVVANLAEEMVVMYRGEAVESGPVEEVFRDPRHPYLRALLHAMPRLDMTRDERLQPLRELRVDPGAYFGTPASDGARAAKGDVLLDVSGLGKHFKARHRGWLGFGAERTVTALSDVGFQIRRGECLGLVGESGSGKTTVSRVLMRAFRPDEGAVRIAEGRVGPENGNGGMTDVLSLEGEDLLRYRRRVQMVFQDPIGSLSPRMTVEQILTEPLEIHGIGTPQSRRAAARDLLGLVGLDARHLKRFPHSFSGGQRQRIVIARALALRPELLICDEPVSALDVSIQAQVLNLLKDLQSELGLTYLFVSHNMAVIDYMADRVMVMCRGYVVELAPRERLFSAPAHPYTRALLAAVPEPDPRRPLDFDRLRQVRATDPSAWPEPFAIDGDRPPGLIDIGGGHWVRAHEADSLELAS